MKLKYNFITNKVADKIIAVAVGKDAEKFSGFIKMNETGAYIFNMLKNNVNENEIITAMEKEYDGVTKEELCTTVREFIEQLNESGVIE